MARIFRRGELKMAVLLVAAEMERAHGYAILAELESRIDGWKASPGAIYPALLALVDSNHLRAEIEGDRRFYVVTNAGRVAAEELSETTRWTPLIERLRRADTVVTVGTVLDQFAAGAPGRRRTVGSGERRVIESILARAHQEILETLDETVGGRHE